MQNKREKGRRNPKKPMSRRVGFDEEAGKSAAGYDHRNNAE
jgi:hypothetical protein